MIYKYYDINVLILLIKYNLLQNKLQLLYFDTNLNSYGCMECLNALPVKRPPQKIMVLLNSLLIWALKNMKFSYQMEIPLHIS